MIYEAEMTFIELTGRVNEQGKMEFEQPDNLAPGEVRIIIESFDTEAEAADEALWQQQFANSPETIEYLVKKGLEAFDSGELEDFDIDRDLEDNDL